MPYSLIILNRPHLKSPSFTESDHRKKFLNIELMTSQSSNDISKIVNEISKFRKKITQIKNFTTIFEIR